MQIQPVVKPMPSGRLGKVFERTPPQPQTRASGTPAPMHPGGGLLNQALEEGLADRVFARQPKGLELFVCFPIKMVIV